MQNKFRAFILKNETKPSRFLILLGILMVLIGLALFVYMGFYNRFWSDDWCYNADFKNLGISGTLNTYFYTGQEAHRGYANNRYSLTLVSGLLYLLGILGAQITATLVIISWLVGLLWVSFNLSKLYKIRSKSSLLLSAAMLLYFTLYISPQRFQVLYWIAGIHYSLTIIMGIYLVGLITHQMTLEKRSKLVDWLIIPLAFIAGGFSETGSAYLFSSAMLLLVFTWYWKRKQAAWALKAYPTVVLVLLSILASLIVLAVAPSNLARSDAISTQHKSLPVTLLLSLRFSIEFMIDSLKSLPVPHLVFMVAFLSLSILSGSSLLERQTTHLWKTALSILTVMIIVWLIISAVQAPNAFFYGAPPDPRGKSVARFTMLAGLAIIAWLTGQAINSSWQNKLLIVIALLGMTVNIVYVARTITRTYSELPGFVSRAKLWDERDADIQAALEQGQTQLEIVVIDMKGAGVRDILRSSTLNGEWINDSCGGRYYGLTAIKAIQP